jgi:hypothetical protein
MGGQRFVHIEGVPHASRFLRSVRVLNFLSPIPGLTPPSRSRQTTHEFLYNQ